MRKAAVRMSADGFTWERWDNFIEEWYPMPLYWTKHEVIQRAAELCGVSYREVLVEPRAAA